MFGKRPWRFIAALLIALMFLSACGGEGAPSVAPASTTGDEGSSSEAAAAVAEAPTDGNPNESPMLWAAVAVGELPPLEERLPQNPLVLEPLEEIGVYGGTLRRGSAFLSAYLSENFTRETLTRWQAPLTNAGPPLPNLLPGHSLGTCGPPLALDRHQNRELPPGSHYAFLKEVLLACQPFEYLQIPFPSCPYRSQYQLFLEIFLL